MGALANARHEKFAQGIAQGLSQRKAYREAFPNSKKWKDTTVDTKAYELNRKGEILERLQELRDESSSKAVKSAQARKEWLSSIVDCETEDMNTRLKACDMLNKMDGEYVTKVEADVNSDVTINIELSDE